MAHVVRAWRGLANDSFLCPDCRTRTTTQVILSRGAGAVQDGATRQTKIIGSDRLVSVEPLLKRRGRYASRNLLVLIPKLIGR